MFEVNLRSKNSIENILIVNEYFTSDFYMAGSKNLELENYIKTNLVPRTFINLIQPNGKASTEYFQSALRSLSTLMFIIVPRHPRFFFFLYFDIVVLSKPNFDFPSFFLSVLNAFVERIHIDFISGRPGNQGTHAS